MIEKEYNFRRLNFDKTGRRKREEKKNPQSQIKQETVSG